MSRVLSLAGFQVTLIGRFWVTTEARIGIQDFRDEFVIEACQRVCLYRETG